MAEHLKTLTYTRTAIALHWAIAVLICVQLATGWWMVRAIDVPGQFDTAFTVYQVHKSVGIVVLLLSLVRLAWRVMHRPPEVPVAVSRWQRRLSFVVHAVLYVLMPVPARGKFVCRISQTNNGRRHDGDATFATADEALRGGLDRLREVMGW